MATYRKIYGMKNVIGLESIVGAYTSHEEARHYGEMANTRAKKEGTDIEYFVEEIAVDVS